MGSFFKGCGCARPIRCPHPYTIRFRAALGKHREEAGYDTQDDAVERLTQIYAEKTAGSDYRIVFDQPPEPLADIPQQLTFEDFG